MSPINKPKFAEQHLDVADHRHIWTWMAMTSRDDPESFVLLTGGNVKRLHALYGTPHWTSDGEQSWTHGWSVASHGLNFVITSGPHSTMFYVRTPTDGEDYLTDPRVAIGATDFLKSLLKQLKAIA